MNDFVIDYHGDASLFRTALSFTAAETGFSERLIEKDYYCSVARLAYRSVISGQAEYLKVEVSVREPIVEPHESLPARTLLLDPFRRAVAVKPFNVRVLTQREAYAEKLRAALSRREPAIRDFFDLDHAFAAGKVSPSDTALVRMLRGKLAVPANEPVGVSEAKLIILRAQVETDLRPVIRVVDFQNFDVDRAFTRVAKFAEAAKDGSGR